MEYNLIARFLIIQMDLSEKKIKDILKHGFKNTWVEI